MHFPNELILAILESSGRHDLKSARLVCKTWCSYASGFLFEKIYVAPNRVDLEVFDAVTQHPILSKCVRNLVYDGSEFVPDLSKRSYVKDLWFQTSMLIDISEPGPYSPDPQINDWASDVSRQGFSVAEVVAKWKDQPLVNDGYKEYQDHSVYQQRALQSGDFVESLVQGLSRLVCLVSVDLVGQWPYSVRTSLWLSTPLARKWNPFHCFPHSWYWDPKNNHSEELPDGMLHYWIITAALVRAQRPIDEFATGRDSIAGISPEVFERRDPLRPSILGLDIAAFSGLKRLHLRLAGCEGLAPDNCDNIEWLPKLLGSMHSLRRLDLELSLSCTEEDHLSLFRCDQVFPQVTTWKNLEAMNLHNFASSATNLLRLLLIQMPNLKSLGLGITQLLEGDWESVIECFKQFNHFTTFKIDYDSILSHNGDEGLECDNNTITEYILHGGRHPCLSDDQPASASEAYILQIDTALRDRLVEMKSSRTHVAT